MAKKLKKTPKNIYFLNILKIGTGRCFFNGRRTHIGTCGGAVNTSFFGDFFQVNAD